MSWKKPVEVMGYNNAIHFFGSVFEAETNCISAHNMGQVITITSNLNVKIYFQHLFQNIFEIFLTSLPQIDSFI